MEKIPQLIFWFCVILAAECLCKKSASDIFAAKFDNNFHREHFVNDYDELTSKSKISDDTTVLRGSYRVLLPDGSSQVVNFEADNSDPIYDMDKAENEAYPKGYPPKSIF